MSRIAVVCGDCDARFNVKAELAGKRVKCPTCGTAVRVVAADDDDDDELPPPTPVRKSAGKSKSKAKSEPKSLLSQILTGVVLTVLVIGGIGLRVWSRVNRIQERNAARQQNAAVNPVNARPQPPAARPTASPQGKALIEKQPGQFVGASGTPMWKYTLSEPWLEATIPLTMDWQRLSTRLVTKRVGNVVMSLMVLGTPGRSAEETAAMVFERTTTLLDQETQSLQLGPHKVTRRLYAAKSEAPAETPPKRDRVAYFYDFPEGGVVLTLLCSQVTDAELAECDQIAGRFELVSMKKASAPTPARLPGNLAVQPGTPAPTTTNAPQSVRIVTTGKPPLAVELELPAGWTPMGARAFQGPGQPLVHVTVLGSGTLPAESAAKLFVRGLLPAEATPEAVTVGTYSGKRQLLKSLETSGGKPIPIKGVNYLFDLPDGGVVLAFRSSEELREGDHTLFEKMASSLKVSKVAEEPASP
jgi:hypothetical protein